MFTEAILVAVLAVALIQDIPDSPDVRICYADGRL